MFLSFFNAKRLVLLGCVLASLARAKEGQKRICDTNLTISNDYHDSHRSNTGGNGNINDRSLSAWTWIPNVSSHRIPHVIFEAVCQSEYCTDPRSGVDERLNSVPIYQDMLVLKQDSQDKMCFRATSETVIVGCTCVRAKTT